MDSTGRARNHSFTFDARFGFLWRRLTVHLIGGSPWSFFDLAEIQMYLGKVAEALEIASKGLALSTADWMPGTFLSALEMLPEADHVEHETFILSKEQVSAIERMSRCDLESRIIKIYAGYKDGALQGYAHIDVHNVRTKPEGFMVVMGPRGTVNSLRILAFNPYDAGSHAAVRESISRHSRHAWRWILPLAVVGSRSTSSRRSGSL